MRIGCGARVICGRRNMSIRSADKRFVRGLFSIQLLTPA